MSNSDFHKITVSDMTHIALAAVIISICSWISIPGPVPFTLQTFGIFVSVGLLGGECGTLAVLLYLLMGAVGLPVFADFTGGFGHLMGATGGYILGFLFSALLMWGFEYARGSRLFTLAFSMVAGLLVCYAFGTAWFMVVYARTSGPIGLLAALSACVFPFILPDLLKIALAMVLCKRLRPALQHLQ